jgi:hypothetical protein
VYCRVGEPMTDGMVDNALEGWHVKEVFPRFARETATAKVLDFCDPVTYDKNKHQL